MSLHRIVPTAVLASAAIAVGAAPASAATLHAAPGGATTGDCKTEATACSLVRATETVATSGDTVIVGTGAYDLTAPLTVHDAKIGLVGAPGPRPTITFPDSLNTWAALFAEHGGVRLSHLAFTARGEQVQLLRVTGGTIDDVDARATGARSSAVLALGDTTVSNTTLLAGTAGKGLSSMAKSNDLRHVSIWSGGMGIYASWGAGSKPTTHLHDSIVHGETADLDLNSSTTADTAVTVDADHSAYRPDKVTKATALATLNDDGGNISAVPLLANPAGGDFHELAGSPTVDAGSTEAQDGPVDIDGAARAQGTATDIGADELTPAAGGGLTGSATTARDTVAPILTHLRVVRVKKHGRTLRLRLSERARVTVRVQRRTARGWKKAGAQRSATLRAGRRTMRLSRRIRAGRYRLLVRATDAAGNTSLIARVAFRVPGRR